MKIPPGGLAGHAEQTVACKIGVAKCMGNGTRRSSPRRKVRAVASTRRKTAKPSKRRSNGKPVRLVKGSAAARRYMAKIRAMRKK